MSLISTDNALLLAGDSFVSEAVADVKVNGNSIIEDGVADIPVVETDVVAMASNLNTSTDNSIPTSKAVRDYTAEQAKEKLSKPSSGIAVGKYFRVASIDSEGNPVLEAVDLPIAGSGTQGRLGLMKSGDGLLNNNGYISVSRLGPSATTNREAGYFVDGANLDLAVRSALTDGIGAAWTDAQKYAFWNRVEKPWVLKATMTGASATVDFTGCTEFIAYGNVTGTGEGVLNVAPWLKTIVPVFVRNGTTFVFMHFKQEAGIFRPIDVRYGTGNQATAAMSGAAREDIELSQITRMSASATYVTSADIKIYAR